MPARLHFGCDYSKKWIDNPNWRVAREKRHQNAKMINMASLSYSSLYLTGVVLEKICDCYVVVRKRYCGVGVGALRLFRFTNNRRRIKPVQLVHQTPGIQDLWQATD